MNILFVCTGNTCRSCMAEAIFNYINKIDNVKAISAGVATTFDSIASRNAATVLENNIGVDISTRSAVQLNGEHVKKSDLILTMTYSIKNYLIGLFPDAKNKIYSLNEYVGVKGDVIDPYGGDIDVYSETFESLRNSLELLLEKLKEDTSI